MIGDTEASTVHEPFSILALQIVTGGEQPAMTAREAVQDMTVLSNDLFSVRDAHGCKSGHDERGVVGLPFVNLGL